MMEWIIKEGDRNFRLEASFLTGWGVDRELRRSNFVRSPEALNGFKSYIRYWSDGIYAIARIHPREGTRRVKVIISYYNNKGRKFRKSPLAGKQAVSICRHSDRFPSCASVQRGISKA